MRRAISLLAVAIVALLASFSASADDSGKCGMNVEWKMYPTAGNEGYYTLEISGRGEMYYYEENGLPWNGVKSRIDKIIIKEGITYIGNYAFDGFQNLTSVSFPSTLTVIGLSAFSECSSLKSVTLPNSLTEIWNYAFSECSSLTSVTFPSSLTSIGMGAFADCNSLRSATLPNSLKDIDDGAFCGCSSLMSLTLPSSLKSIPKAAFGSCESLTSITLPSSVTFIGREAFSDCNNLRTINALRKVAPSCEDKSAFRCFDSFYRIYRQCKLNVPAGAEASYRNNSTWKYFYTTVFRAL